MFRRGDKGGGAIRALHSHSRAPSEENLENLDLPLLSRGQEGSRA